MKEWRDRRYEEFHRMLAATSTGMDEREDSAVHNELRLLEEKMERNVKYVPAYYWNGRMVYRRVVPVGERTEGERA